jgi:DNA-binding transcriptional ArsR family regulator
MLMSGELPVDLELTQRFADRGTAEQMASYLSHFGNPLRLRLLCRMVCMGACSVNELAEWAGESQSAVSRQLRLLWSARLVDRRKQGTRVFYSVGDPAVAETMRFFAALADRVRQPAGWSDLGLEID